ncbi:MAG TPA: serine/threonine-protein kinase PknK, partial [Bacilli bacterium]|nr:serine/threonine-protein kinase PknK [Bacilli bacterium]
MLFKVGHYEVTEEIAVGPESAIYRAVDGETGQSVILKTLRAEYPPLEQIVKIKREYEIAHALDEEGIVKALALLPYQNGVLYVQEDFGGVSLHEALGGRRMELGMFLSTAMQLTETIGRLHQQQVVHKDIKPHNIIVDLSQGLVKLTDFGIASQLTHERQVMVNPDQLEGTLAYMSPEQTGRMNRKIDFRTDFYSLGVTFYEMLTGELPFPANDPVELIHCQIAKQPKPPSEVDPQIPQVLSDIVMRLLAKNAEDRYQSAFGLRTDLAICQGMWQEAGAMHPFALGASDKSELFNIPEKLYGREADVATMRRVFDRVCVGGSELLLVSGISGIGKSSFVHELQKVVVREQGFFLEGKFDQFKRHLPYDALLQALRGLMHQLLTESEASIARWRDKLLQALGPNGQVLIDVIPELELIIGEQPPVGTLPPAETLNRFQLVMNNLLRVFTQREHPLVLFLDDLQWADSASLQLIEAFMADESNAHLLFIGSYRDNEVSAEDRLLTMIADLQKKGRPVTDIRLQPFEEATVTRLLVDTFACEEEQAAPFARLVTEKTNGNPFFVKQFLQGLYEQQQVVFDSSLGRWTWELDVIRELEITDNVVEFMLAQVKKLPPSTQDVLKVAACIGNTFDLRALAYGCGRSVTEIADELWLALQEGMIVPVGMAYKLLYATGTEEPAKFNPAFRFLHDRVQQVAHSLLSMEEQQAVHLAIGQLLLSQAERIEQEERLFEIVNHLNIGRRLIANQDERIALARLNLLAGQRAKQATAYEPALRYLHHGTDLLEAEEDWQRQYDLLFPLTQELAEVEYLCERYEQAESLIDQLIERAQPPLHKAQVYNLKVSLYTHLARFTEAIDVGVEAARMLGIRLPKKMGKGSVAVAFFKMYRKLRRYSFDDLLNLPVDEDPVRAELLKIFLNLCTTTFAFNQNLFALLILQALDLSLKYGNNMLSAMGYGGIGILIGAILGDYQKLYDYGVLGYRIDSRYGID